MSNELRFLDSITPTEVDEFLEYFNIKRCVTIKQLEKLLLKRKGDVIYHDLEGWHTLTINNLDSVNLKVSNKGVIYNSGESSLSVFYIRNKRVLQSKLKHWVCLDRGTFGYMDGMAKYLSFFKSKGFGGIDRSIKFSTNRLVSFKNDLIELPSIANSQNIVK